jgi:mevalonate kinase
LNKNHANGKLLITGEYLILEGAYSLAIPCSKGQKIEYFPDEKSNTINWKSFDYLNELWFSTKYDAVSLKIIETNDNLKAIDLQRILLEAYKLSKTVKLNGQISTFLDFPNNWGLGSSSTLIVCISKLLNINPLELHFNTSKGSGYDVACGNSNKPITYLINNKKPIVKEIDFNIPFAKNIFFIHLNKKQKSENEIIRFKKQTKNKSININSISDITSKMINCNQINLFNDLIEEHENIISYYIDKLPIKKELFSDFEGSIKSLGAWGGDFIMASSKNNCNDYFKSKGFDTIISYEKMIKNQSFNVDN